MHTNMLGLASAVVGVAAAVAVAAAPSASAAATDPTPVANGAAQPTQHPAAPSRANGPVALPPGGPVSVLPRDSAIGGADPYLPFGTDPFVPDGVWTP